MKPGTLTLCLAAIAFGAVAHVAAAHAQTATNLECKGCVGKKDIGKKAVTSKHIKDGSIAAVDLQDGAVGSAQLHNDAVTSAKIQNNSVGPDDLAAAAKPSGVEFEESTLSYAIPDVVTTVRSISIDAPVDGYVLAMANWFYYSGSASAYAACFLTTEENGATGPHIDGNSGTNTNYRAPASMARTFPVQAGVTTFYLSCYDGGSFMQLAYPMMNALFVPNRY